MYFVHINTVKSINMELLDNIKKAEQAVYDHIGYEGNWTVYPIDDITEYFWRIDGTILWWCDKKEVLLLEYPDDAPNEDQDNLYTADIIGNQIHRGKDMSGIVIDTYCDYNKFLAIVDNTKEVV